MNKSTVKSHRSVLVLLFSLIYMISYTTRINYDAIISEKTKWEYNL